MNANSRYEDENMQSDRSTIRLGSAMARTVAIITIFSGAALVSPALASPAALTIVKNNDLNFGAFVVITNGVVTVDATNAVTYSNAVAVSGASPAPARFTVNGEPNADVTILIPASPLTQNGTGVSAIFSDFQAKTSGAGPTLTGTMFDITLPATGTLDLYIGGKVSISRSTGSGSLSVSIPVTATYKN
jgi:hypothetical protein